MTLPIKTKRIMLANLQAGQCIDYIAFEHGNPVHRQAEIIRIEKDFGCGCVWTVQGPLSWQLLTFKYSVVVPQNRPQRLPQPKLNRLPSPQFRQPLLRHSLHARVHHKDLHHGHAGFADIRI